MSTFPQIYLARHGETSWSLCGQHTGRTDIPLTSNGEKEAYELGAVLQKKTIPHVFSSPLGRAMSTAKLAGFGKSAISEPLLLEWNYGDYEGLTSKEIHSKNPKWQLFRDGCPNGESPSQVAARCDEIVEKISTLKEDAIIFAHGHILRMLAARWLGLKPMNGHIFFLSTASLSILGYEHTLSDRVIRLWNDTTHLSSL